MGPFSFLLLVLLFLFFSTSLTISVYIFCWTSQKANFRFFVYFLLYLLYILLVSALIFILFSAAVYNTLLNPYIEWLIYLTLFISLGSLYLSFLGSWYGHLDRQFPKCFLGTLGIFRTFVEALWDQQHLYNNIKTILQYLLPFLLCFNLHWWCRNNGE